MSLRDTILKALAFAGAEGMSEANLLKAVQEEGVERETLHLLLESMIVTGGAIRLPSERLVNPAALHWIVGRLSTTPKGTGFVVPDDREIEDLMIPKTMTMTAVDGDRVAAQPIGARRGRDAGAVVAILERRHRRLVGQYFQGGRHHGIVVPKAKRLGRNAEVPALPRTRARDGDWVIVQVDEWTEHPDPLRGKVIDVLGEEGTPDVDLPVILEQHGVDPDWPEAVLEQVEKIPLEIPEETIRGRRDLRDIVTLTIDPETAKDFDDALSIEELGDANWRLGVHIADVAEHVTRGTPLDDEARWRGTSIYPVDKVIPMLPERLSNVVCSLRPDEDSLCLSVFMEIDAQGEFVGEPEICEAVMRSARRLNYGQAQRLFDDKLAEEDFEAVHGFERELFALRDVARALQRMRERRGSLDMDLPEPTLVLDENRKVKEIVLYPRWESHRLVEQCMLAANEAIAEYLTKRHIPAIYRDHDEPDGERLLKLIPALRALGVKGHVPHHRPEPADYQEFLDKTRDLSGSSIIHRLLLRSLSLAVYDTENRGHFGLASECYTHFTSPIRRYPDLIVHRVLKAHLRGGKPPKGPAREAHEEELAAIALLSSQRERRAERVERDVVKLKTLQFLEPRIGETMKGRISGIIPRGVFIELEDVPADGFVPIDTLPEDWYVFDEETLTLHGEDTGLVFRLAQEVKVRLISCDTAALELTLAIVDEGLNKRNLRKGERGSRSGKRRGPPGGQAHGGGRGRGKGKRRGRR